MRATAARWGRKVFAPSMIAKLVREAFARFGRRADEPMRAQRAPAPARRQGFMLEPIEPRLLLSADLSYFGPAANPSATQFWLKAINSTQVQLFDSATDTSSSVVPEAGLPKIGAGYTTRTTGEGCGVGVEARVTRVPVRVARGVRVGVRVGVAVGA